MATDLFSPVKPKNNFANNANNGGFKLEDSELFKGAKGTVKEQLAGDTPGFQEQASETREALKTGQAQAQKAQREALFGAGLADTGKRMGFELSSPQQQLRERTALERGLTADRGALQMQQKALGVQGATNLLGQQQQGQLTREQIASQEQQQLRGIASTEMLSQEDRALQERLQKAGITSTEKLAEQGISSQERMQRLGIQSTEELAQYDRNLKERLQREQIESSERQQRTGIESTEKIAFANLTLEEQRMALQSEQFDDKLDFDKWATQAGLDDNAAARIWQSNENVRDQKVRTDIANMQNDTQRWMQDRAEVMMQAGFDQDQAILAAQQEYDGYQNDLNRELQREVESGRLTIEESKLAQQASQFDSQQTFDTWAIQQGFDENTRQRTWEAGQQVSQNAYLSGEATLDRQLQKEIESGRLGIQEAQLAQDASQFATQQEWTEKAFELGLDEAEANRVWQAGENAFMRTHDAQMQQVANAFAREGQEFQTVMNFLQTMDPEQAGAVMNDLAVSAGLNWTDDEGVEHDGLKPVNPNVQATADIADSLSSNVNLTVDQMTSLIENIDNPAVARQIGYVGSAPFDGSTTSWTTKDGKRRWALKPEAKTWAENNVGKIVTMPDGKIVKITGVSEPTTKKSRSAILVKDLETGEVIRW